MPDKIVHVEDAKAEMERLLEEMKSFISLLDAERAVSYQTGSYGGVIEVIRDMSTIAEDMSQLTSIMLSEAQTVRDKLHATLKHEGKNVQHSRRYKRHKSGRRVSNLTRSA